MQLENTTIRKMSIEELGELLAQDMIKISEDYSFAFASKTDAIKLMKSFLEVEYSNINNNNKKEFIDFYSAFEDVMNNYIRIIFETDYELAYTKLFNKYVDQKIGEINSYKQTHYEIRKIINFFKIINYHPSEIVCTNILENNPKFSTMIGKIVDRNIKKLSTMNVKETFPDSIMLSFVTTYAFINKIEIKTNEEEQKSTDFMTLPNDDSYSDDNVKLYINSLQKPLLPSEQRKLFLKLKEGDKNARKRLIETNLGLVVPIASYYRNRGVEFLDLIQEGNIGLMKAVDKFDTEMGCAFSTYAYWWIKDYVSRGVMKYGKTIAIPTYIQAIMGKYNFNFNELTNKLNNYPTQQEIMEELNLTSNQLNKLTLGSVKMLSLDEPLGIDNDLPLGELIAADDLSIEESYEKKALEIEVRNLLNNDFLDNRAIKILKLRNGFYNNRVYPYQEVGDMLKISKQRVKQIEARAYKKIKNSDSCDDVLAYLTNGTKIKERITKELAEELAMQKANRFQINQAEKPDIRKIYAYFTGYKREEIAKVVSSLSEENIEIIKELFGNNLEKLSYQKKSTTTSLEKYCKEIVPIVEDKLNSDYIKVSNYYIKCNGLSFAYGKEEYTSLDNIKFDELEKFKINYARIRASLTASFQTDTSSTLNERKSNIKSIQKNDNGQRPKILIYK